MAAMHLSKLDLLALQTEYMRGDPVVKALCEGLAPELIKAWEQADYITDWTNIDRYPDEILDEIAWELHIDWYDKGALTDVKRKLIKNSDKVHMTLGTPYAVEQVIQDYFGDGYIKEWFEYGGQPGYFRIYSGVVLHSLEDYLRFLQILERVKRKSAWLEGLFQELKEKRALHLSGLTLIVTEYASGIAHQL